MYPNILYGPLAPADLSGTGMTAAEELRAYRNYLIAYRTALRDATTDAHRAYAATLLAQANYFKDAYLSRGDNDLTTTDKVILAAADGIASLGKALDATIEWAGDKVANTAGKILPPFMPILLVGLVGLFLYTKRK